MLRILFIVLQIFKLFKSFRIFIVFSFCLFTVCWLTRTFFSKIKSNIKIIFSWLKNIIWKWEGIFLFFFIILGRVRLGYRGYNKSPIKLNWYWLYDYYFVILGKIFMIRYASLFFPYSSDEVLILRILIGLKAILEKHLRFVTIFIIIIILLLVFWIFIKSLGSILRPIDRNPYNEVNGCLFVCLCVCVSVCSEGSR